MFYTKKKQQMIENLAKLYLIMKDHVPNPDSLKANELFVDIAHAVIKDGEIKMLDLVADGYLAENSNSLAKGGDV